MSADTFYDVTGSYGMAFYGGLPNVTSGIGSKYDIALNGVGYMLDTADQNFTGPQSIPAIRTGGDFGTTAGEQTLTREDLWRRVVTSWHHGAGQRWMDRNTSDDLRFWASKGVNVWTHDRLSLLPDVTHPVTTATAGEMVAIVSTVRAYLHYTDNGTWRVAAIDPDDTVNGGFSGAVIGVTSVAYGTDYTQFASDGSTVYAIDSGGTQIRNCIVGSTFAAAWATTTVATASIGYAHGHLLAGGGTGGRTLYDCTATGAGTAVSTLTDLGSSWLCFAEGTSVIYGAVNCGGVRQSRIYKIAYDPNNATLSVPSVAGTIPVGETIRGMCGYLGLLFVGTSKGFRMCREAADGTLTVGPLIPITGGVRTFAANAQFVYFGWGSYDSTSSGLGRIDITTFTDSDLVPAYASDLMAPVVGAVPSVVTVNNSNTTVNAPRQWFTVTGGGIYGQHATNLVASGTLDTGLIGYGFPENKDADYVDVRHEPLAGTVTVYVAGDQGTFNIVDVSGVAGTSGMLMKVGHHLASRHEMRLALGQGSATTGPAVNHVTFEAYPSVPRGDIWALPILLGPDVTLGDQSQGFYDFWAQVHAFKILASARSVVSFQIGSQTFTCYVEDYKTQHLEKVDDPSYGPCWQGVCLLILKDLERVLAQ